jgi:hypothetical protein
MGHYATLNLPVLEARTDWITCTARRGPMADELLAFAEAELLDQRDAGDKLSAWAFQSYKGFQAGDIRWGWGEHGGLVVASQALSNDIAPELARLANHWSRVDYCVTVLDTAGAIHPDDDYWADWLRLYRYADAPVHLRRTQSFQRGATLALGSRQSPTYLRCYDKHAESHGDYPKGAWRWELELKQGQSEAAQSRWRESPVGSAYIAGMVAYWPTTHGLEVPWRADPVIEPPGRIAHTRDADRLLKWFRTQVAPSVQWVAQARGKEEVRRALNI